MMDLGVVGMAVMGRNLAMNAASKGFNVGVYNRTTSRTDEAVTEAKQQGVTLHPFTTVEDLVKNLQKPRKIIIMVQAGKPVDAMLEQLAQAVEPGDILVDGGNEYYQNTEKRYNIYKEKQIHFMGMGVSGGEEGARHGPSIMPGGDRYAWEHMEPILTKIAAQVGDQACCKYMGNGAAGHYVKMVHNGIEYGDMQLISEVYGVLTSVMGKTPGQCAEIFKNWNKGRLASYLIEITATVLETQYNGKPLVDQVLDVAVGKGTGKWTIQEAAEKGVPCPVIAAALDARNLSGMTEIRSLFNKATEGKVSVSRDVTISLDDLEQALYASKICSYAQGLNLLAKASEVHNFEINLEHVSSIWVGGCIIRADFLDRITKAYKNEALAHLFLDDSFLSELLKATESWRKVVCECQTAGVSVPAIGSALNYFNALRASHLPLNLVQAQRDYFGAHTFKFRDGSGPYHANWHEGTVKKV